MKKKQQQQQNNENQDQNQDQNQNKEEPQEQNQNQNQNMIIDLPKTDNDEHSLFGIFKELTDVTGTLENFKKQMKKFEKKSSSNVKILIQDLQQIFNSLANVENQIEKLPKDQKELKKIISNSNSQTQKAITALNKKISTLENLTPSKSEEASKLFSKIQSSLLSFSNSSTKQMKQLQQESGKLFENQNKMIGQIELQNKNFEDIKMNLENITKTMNSAPFQNPQPSQSTIQPNLPSISPQQIHSPFLVPPSYYPFHYPEQMQNLPHLQTPFQIQTPPLLKKIKTTSLREKILKKSKEIAKKIKEFEDEIETENEDEEDDDDNEDEEKLKKGHDLNRKRRRN